MTQVTARIKAKGKNFEIMVDVDSAVRLKKGDNVDIRGVLAVDRIYYDMRKATQPTEKDLLDCFGTNDIWKIAEKIIRQGEIMLPIDYRNKEREEKVKQVVDFLSKNAVDPRTDKPYTSERIKNLIEQAGVNIENKPISEQISKIIEKLSVIAPIKISVKKIKLTIPAVYTGKVYTLVNQYKEDEEWENDGSLICVVKIPAGLQMEFYDKINSMTHGGIITQELKNG